MKAFEKLKIKAKPGRYQELKQTCKKLQGIIDRRLSNEANKKVPSYKEELYFYSVFIPNLIPEMSIYKDIDEKEKMKILKFKIAVWTKANINECAKLISVFDEGHLTDIPLGSPGSAVSGSSPRRVASRKIYMSPVAMTPSIKSPVKRKSSSKK